jgi:ApaG protein
MSQTRYQAVTRGIRVSVQPQYLEDESDPDEDRYFWAYLIEIENESGETVRLRSRVWQITDETGHVEEVRGPGVVGQTPILKPGETFRYTSGCPLSTPSGMMVGSFQMTNEDGELFDVAVPAFSLDSPECKRVVN